MPCRQSRSFISGRNGTRTPAGWFLIKKLGFVDLQWQRGVMQRITVAALCNRDGTSEVLDGGKLL